VAGRQWSTPINKVTLDANKLSVGFPLVHLVVEYAAVVRRRGAVTSVCATTRLHRWLQSLHVVTLNALDFRMNLVSKRAGRSAPAPHCHCDRIVKPNRLR